MFFRGITIHPFKGIEQSPETPTKCINSMRQGILLAPTNEAKKEAKLLKLGIKIQIITTHHNKLLNQFYYYKQRINGFHFLWFWSVTFSVFMKPRRIKGIADKTFTHIDSSCPHSHTDLLPVNRAMHCRSRPVQPHLNQFLPELVGRPQIGWWGWRWWNLLTVYLPIASSTSSSTSPV